MSIFITFFFALQKKKTLSNFCVHIADVPEQNMRWLIWDQSAVEVLILYLFFPHRNFIHVKELFYHDMYR